MYPPEMFLALERRKLLPISVNVSDATRSDMATAERQAAVWCVIGSQDVSEDRRRELAKSYATDSDATIQRLAITGDDGTPRVLIFSGHFSAPVAMSSTSSADCVLEIRAFFGSALSYMSLGKNTHR